MVLSIVPRTACSKSFKSTLGRISPRRRPISAGIRLRSFCAAGVKRRIRTSLPTITMGIFMLPNRFSRSLFARLSSILRFCNSSLRVVSSSLVDCNSSLAVSNSSLVLCSSSLVDKTSSLADLYSSDVVSCSSISDCSCSRSWVNSRFRLSFSRWTGLCLLASVATCRLLPAACDAS